MAKRSFSIAPKLDEPHTPTALPVQDFSPAQLEGMAGVTALNAEEEAKNSEKTKNESKKAAAKPAKMMTAAQKMAASKSSRFPAVKKSVGEAEPSRRGRPEREEEVRRLTTTLPVAIFDRMQAEIKTEGYSLSGFLTRALRAYFEQIDG